MYDREILKYLLEWKNSNTRKPIVLRGARQVGKTTLVELFAKYFDQYLYLNLDEPDDKKIFDGGLGFEGILDALFFLKNGNKSIANTLIFIDEIQNSAVAVNSLRYFYEKRPDLYVMAAGSLLETLLEKNSSFPVGRVEFLSVRPFSFKEFLLAGDEQSALAAWNTVPVPAYAHEKLTNLFKIYALIGGMPEVIKVYLSTRDLTQVAKVIRNLVISYTDDVEKYTKGRSSRTSIRHIMDNAFYHAGERITFAGFGNSNYRSREMGEAFRILEKTMLLRLVYPVTRCTLPLLPDRKKSPKLQVVDTGLVNFLSGIDKEIYKANDIADVYRGRIAEHITGQELMSNFLLPDSELHFWVREKLQSGAEVDFVIPCQSGLVPVEVKSGTSGKLRSLVQFIRESGQKYAVRIYSREINISKEMTEDGKEFVLINLPFYLSARIAEYVEWVRGKDVRTKEQKT